MFSPSGCLWLVNPSFQMSIICLSWNVGWVVAGAEPNLIIMAPGNQALISILVFSLNDDFNLFFSLKEAEIINVNIVR